MLPDQKLVNGHISVEPLPPLWLLYVRERGTRSPARFAPPRGRGGDRSVPRGCPEPAAPLGPAGGAGSAHPLRTRRLGRGARGGLGLRLAAQHLGSLPTTRGTAATRGAVLWFLVVLLMLL